MWAADVHLSLQAQAVMLMTVAFGKADGQGARPLSNKEWARFATWLKDQGLEPSSLLAADPTGLLTGWLDRSITVDRVQALLRRGAALAIALEKWQRAGLWVMTRADADYPDRLKRRLKTESPPVLFGCGNRALLNSGGIAVVGSRKAEEDDLAFAAGLGERAAAEGLAVVSGSARGIDQSAMLGALEQEGTAVGVLAESLIRSATSQQFRRRIMSGNLALVTPFNPEAGFNVGHAMARNRYIYCLADAAVVVSSAAGEGGTWNGAIEDLEAAWVPLWVRRSASLRSGNIRLAERGARWLPDVLPPLVGLATGATAPVEATPAPEMLPLAGEISGEPQVIETPAEVPDCAADVGNEQQDSTTVAAVGEPPVGLDFYLLFLRRLGDLTPTAAMLSEEIAARLGLEKPQVAAWLKRGLVDRKILKRTKPTTYRLAKESDSQGSLPLRPRDGSP
jgi:predicted Rossmann fold nucleotide-binding protein DprA/Smf involved in DNA uptake